MSSNPVARYTSRRVIFDGCLDKVIPPLGPFFTVTIPFFDSLDTILLINPGFVPALIAARFEVTGSSPSTIARVSIWSATENCVFSGILLLSGFCCLVCLDSVECFGGRVLCEFLFEALRLAKVVWVLAHVSDIQKG